MATPSLPYSPAIRAGEFLFVSGQIGLKEGALIPGGLEAEVKQSFENLQSVLTANNVQITNIVKTTVFITNMDDFGRMNELYAEFFGSHLPARATVAVSALPRGACFEIEAVAYYGALGE